MVDVKDTVLLAGFVLCCGGTSAPPVKPFSIRGIYVLLRISTSISDRVLFRECMRQKRLNIQSVTTSLAAAAGS